MYFLISQKIIQIFFPKIIIDFILFFFYSFPSSVSLSRTLLRICKKILYLKIMSMQLSTYSSPFWLLVKGSMLGSCLTSPAPITIKGGFSLQKTLILFKIDIRAWHIHVIKKIHHSRCNHTLVACLPPYTQERWRIKFWVTALHGTSCFCIWWGTTKSVL